ncbi:Uncharacterised protein [uncultured Flavonifractor sp.]|jgi:hypothetical protein|uniref:Uncharacterized protein n=1 Tax=Flintibacter hominis TaxID=2763048 RepID=A0A8J6IZV0_9FIRM|nr:MULTISPECIES: hypothetical protein [Eubacteriales]MBS5589403.1 hypothetical protein [Clostridiales bacterium]SCH42302.1 Uncharacterised protein [uncultured Clostridium sp.]SCI59951.1 Uncharacterised protein [uncultured Flavonifractor sp.]MBC5722101.1 hypothetical protein [Flintibacter hominis]MCH1980715.1 hypothetical protein [Lawsonibacter sp. OA9]
MTNHIKTGLCAAVLVLALLAAYLQDVSYQGGGPGASSASPIPFSYLAPGR